MAMNAYLHLKGQKTGDIKGSCTQKGREGQIVVIEAHHEVVSPRDAASGLPTGKRLHKPFVITKEVDKATPLLYQALVNNELLSEFELHFWRPGIKSASGAGAEVQYYTVKLRQAQIVDIAFTQPNTRDLEAQKTAEFERIAFTYQHIEWVWVDGGITASDDSTLPVA
jgi:type VI secretion system secreted protein Hcp